MRRHLFLLIILLLTAWRGNAQTMQGYEYWFDDGYSSKTAVTSGQPYVSFEADVSGLQAGLHYLNFRAQDVDGVWGALSRYIIYLTADSRGNSDMVAYEYWMDTDYSHRTSVKGSIVTSPFTVDVSNLQAGLHYFNFRAQCSDGQWGALSRHIVYLTADSRGNSDMVAYEYWMDTDYSHRTSVKGSTVTSPFTVDVSNLQAGLHYFNFRAQCSDGQWGALSRYIVYLTADSRGNSDMVAYEYWMDTDYSHRTSVKGSTVTSPFTVDVSDLQPGLHYFNFRAQCSDGHWGALSRYIVYISDAPASSNLAAVDYWIDSNPTKIQRQQVTDNTIVISADISKLPKGMHTFYVEGIASDGTPSMLNGYEFEVEAGDVEPYAVLSENNTVLTFYCDDQKAIRDGMGIGPFDDSNARGWKDACQSITTVVFDESFANCTTITSTRAWFSECSNMTTITGIDYLKTDNVTDMGYMFEACSNLTNIDLSGFKTDNVTDMGAMFSNCSKLASIDLSGFKTDNVTDMSSMFWGCSSLTSVDLSMLNTENVTSLGAMFYGCTGLTSVDLTGFKTDKVTSMYIMFQDCSHLTTIYASEGWSTASISYGDNMFVGCTNLVGGKGTTYNLDHTDYTYARIDGGPNSQTPGYFTDKNAPVVTDPEPYAVLSENNTVLTFYYDEHKEERNGMDVGPFEYSGDRKWHALIYTIESVVFDPSFAGCTTLTSTAYWFCDNKNLTSISGLEYLNTAKVTNMNEMFGGCSNLTNLDLSGFNTANVTNMAQMFDGCNSLTTLDVSNFNTAKVTNMNQMFDGCSALTTLDVSSFNTANVTDMKGMFRSCSNLTTIYAGNEWTTAAVTEGTEMFDDSHALVGGKGTHYDPDHVDFTYARIDGGPDSETPGYFTRKGDSPWVEPGTPEPYAVLSENNTVLTFYYDTEKERRNGMSVGPFEQVEDREWDNTVYSINRVVFDESFANCLTITSTKYWFVNCLSLVSITGINNLKTDNVTDMNGMFVGCERLTSLDVSGFNTNNVTNFGGMFFGCSSLTNLDVSHFVTTKATDMGQMFYGCSSLTHIDVSGFNTSNVTNLFQMFSGCSSLTTLDVSAFNTKNVEELAQMFHNCSGLTHINVSNFITENVWDMQYMFGGCSNLLELNISGFNTKNVRDFLGMLDGCSNLASIQAGSAAIPDSIYAQIGNPNLLVYVNEARLAPEGVQNVVVNGVAKEIVLKDAEGNNNWYCPEPFRAEKISYTREFRQQTQIGISRGWESLALPFAVQTITHQDKGVIAPFGSDASGLHFWLRRLGHEGLISVQMIEPNTPYIISMPNSEDYASRFNLNGRVTFAAQDAYVERTEQMADESADYMMVPAFQRMAVSEDIYALNVGEERNGRPEGSIFERNYREVRPFEAYTLHRGDRPAPLFVDLSDLEGSTTDVPDVRWMMDDGNGEWYDLQGRTPHSQGENVQRSTLKKGVYIRNGRKTVVK